MEHSLRELGRTEKRRGMRVPATLYRENGMKAHGMLADLSYDGCRLFTSAEFSVGEPVTLVVLNFGAEVSAVVRWSQAGELGLSFADADCPEQWPEREERRPVSLEASIRSDNGLSVEARVTNFSVEGCEVSASLPVGETVEFSIEPIGRLTAQVRWSFLTKSGLNFVRPSKP